MYQANNPQEYEDLGYQYWKRGNMEEALGIFREGVDRFPDSLNLGLCLGFCLIDMDEYVDARKIFEDILKHSPQNEDALMGMGKIYITMSKFEEAEQYFRIVLKANSESESLFLEVARSYYEANCPEDALGYYKGALIINPDSEEGNFGLGVCYHLLGRVDSAKHYIVKALKYVEGNFYYEALCYYGHLLYDENRVEEALKYFEQIPIEKLNDLTSLNRMVKIYKDKGKTEEELSVIFAKIDSMERIHSKQNPLYNIKVKEAEGSDRNAFYRCRQKELIDSVEFTCGECPNIKKRIQQRKIIMDGKEVGYWMSCDLSFDEFQKLSFGNCPEKGRYVDKK